MLYRVRSGRRMYVTRKGRDVRRIQQMGGVVGVLFLLLFIFHILFIYFLLKKRNYFLLSIILPNTGCIVHQRGAMKRGIALYSEGDLILDHNRICPTMN